MFSYWCVIVFLSRAEAVRLREQQDREYQESAQADRLAEERQRREAAEREAKEVVAFVMVWNNNIDSVYMCMCVCMLCRKSAYSRKSWSRRWSSRSSYHMQITCERRSTFKSSYLTFVHFVRLLDMIRNARTKNTYAHAYICTCIHTYIHEYIHT